MPIQESFDNRSNSIDSPSQRIRQSQLNRYLLGWIPRPKQWISINWFGGIQIVTREEES